MATRNPPRVVLQLRIELAGVEPPVWRRLLVPGSVKLAKLHDILQAVMDWNDSHLHAFHIGKRSYGVLEDDHEDDDEEIDEDSVTILGALEDDDHFTYEYDFGDGWEHEIVVEKKLPQYAALKFAVCLDGANACPPDDVGGPGGYAHFLAALGDPTHADHQDLKEWIGVPFDPSAFDIGEVNVTLQMIR